MRINTIYFSLMFICFAATSCAQKKLVSGKVTYLQPYCGGARPTPEIEAKAREPKPYALKSVIIVSEKGKVDSVKTDAEGMFKKNLAPGKYKLYESWRYYKRTPNGEEISHFDKSCLQDEWKKEFRKITVTKSKVSEEDVNEINLKCDWSQPCILDQFKPPMRQ